ncbi:contact-dependent growth inhibition system immunity protein [Cupriavidus pauculus]|uniref:DUF1436 family protein n=1 Tax=Cupriavidus pauculus TaxID=82633 RepID=A0A3G8H313_9BURK|nr:contact-dependent growth inhibition system immunity protein [Cupriavidus pauculus]AZG14867.1 DUF1436 family protein [Cupriavidus pauculus]
MSEPIWERMVIVTANDKFICLVPQSGYRLAMADPTAPERLFAPDAPDSVLSEAIKGALSESRFLTLEEARVMRSLADSRDAEWARFLMERYGYKSKQALFKNMKGCSVVISGNELILSPSHHDKLDSWGRSKDDGIEDVIIPSNSSCSAFGTALRLALSRCTG